MVGLSTCAQIVIESDVVAVERRDVIRVADSPRTAIPTQPRVSNNEGLANSVANAGLY